MLFSPSARSLMPRMIATGDPLRWAAWATPAASISMASASLYFSRIHSASREIREFCTISPAAMGAKWTFGARSPGAGGSHQSPVRPRWAPSWLISWGASQARGRALRPSSSLVPPW